MINSEIKNFKYTIFIGKEFSHDGSKLACIEQLHLKVYSPGNIPKYWLMVCMTYESV
jgi:hypothetical protein